MSAMSCSFEPLSRARERVAEPGEGDGSRDPRVQRYTNTLTPTLSRAAGEGVCESRTMSSVTVEFCRVLSTLTPTLSRLREREPAKAAI